MLEEFLQGTFFSMYPIDRSEIAPLIAAVRSQLGEAAFADAWAEGRSMTPEQALAAVD